MTSPRRPEVKTYHCARCNKHRQRKGRARYWPSDLFDMSTNSPAVYRVCGTCWNALMHKANHAYKKDES